MSRTMPKNRNLGKFFLTSTVMLLIGIITSLIIGYMAVPSDSPRSLGMSSFILLLFGGLYVFLGDTHVLHVTQDFGSVAQRVMLENNSPSGSFQERSIRIFNTAPTDLAFIITGLLLIAISLAMSRLF